MSAIKEVVLTAGSIDTPKLLLLSGIGPTKELSKLQIPCILDVPAIGQNLQDHCGVRIIIRMSGDFSDRWAFASNPGRVEAARSQWARDQTGPMSDLYSNGMICFTKLPELENSMEMEELDPSTREYLEMKTVPHFEIIAV